MKVKIAKGGFGYIDYMKKASVIKTAVLFALAAAVFATGLIIFGKKENVITILAVLVVLPASRALVNAIMFYRFRSAPLSLKEGIDAKGASALCYYDSVLTLERGGSYYVECFFCDGRRLLGLFEGSKSDRLLLREHLETMMMRGGIRELEVSFVSGEAVFTGRIGTAAVNDDRMHKVFEVLSSVSL